MKTPELKPLSEIEKEYILFTLAALNYNRTHAAIALNIGARTLQRKLKSWGLENVGKKSETLESA